MSSWQLSFSARHFYGRESAITIPIAIHTDPSTRIQVRAKLDTGSDLCVFQKSHAELLGLELERGIEQRIGTVVGAFTAYGHEVTLTMLDLEWQATVYFAEPEDFPVNVVGRIGFLDRLRLGLIDYDQVLYLAAYDE